MSFDRWHLYIIHSRKKYWERLIEEDFFLLNERLSTVNIDKEKKRLKRWTGEEDWDGKWEMGDWRFWLAMTAGGRRSSKLTNENHQRRLLTRNNQMQFAPRAGNNDDGVYCSMLRHVLYYQRSSRSCCMMKSHIESYLFHLASYFFWLLRPHGANRHFRLAVVTRSIITSRIPLEISFLSFFFFFFNLHSSQWRR